MSVHVCKWNRRSHARVSKNVPNEFWCCEDTRSYSSEALFIFGDNEHRIGVGGQAIIRNEPNTVGIRTKRYPTRQHESFWNGDSAHYYQMIDEDLQNLKVQCKKYKIVFVPADGLGTGLAELPKRSPRVYAYLTERLQDLQNWLNSP